MYRGFCVKNQRFLQFFPLSGSQTVFTFKSLNWNHNKLYFLDVAELPSCLTKESISTVPEDTSLQYGLVFPVLTTTQCLSISEPLFNSVLSASIRKLQSSLQTQVSSLAGYFISVFTHQSLRAPAPSLYKPVPWKLESPGVRDNGGGGGGGRVKSSF